MARIASGREPAGGSQTVRKPMMEEAQVKDVTKTGRALRRAVCRELAVRDWSQTRLAERAGIPRETLNRILNGRTPDVRTIDALAEAFGMEPGELLQRGSTRRSLALPIAEQRALRERWSGGRDNEGATMRDPERALEGGHAVVLHSDGPRDSWGRPRARAWGDPPEGPQSRGTYGLMGL